MYVTLKHYLEQLNTMERRRPEGERRHVPTLEELADVAELHPVTLSNIVNNKINRLNLDAAKKIIAYIRALGFDMQTTDFIEYREI